MKPEQRSLRRQTGTKQGLTRWGFLLEIVLSVGMAGAAVYGLFHWGIGAAVHRRPEVMVPDVMNKPVAVALELLKPVNLSLQKEGEEFHQTLPPGVIIRQIPAAGLMVREGKAVRVVLSQGGQTLFVPDIVGRPLRTAEIALRQAGFGVGELASQPSLRFGKEIVMAQEPSAGGVVEKGALVNLVVSAGPPPPDMPLMPDLTGKPIETAETWAKEQQLTLQIQEVSLLNALPDRVVAQQPLPDAPLQGVKGVQVMVNRPPSPLPDGPRLYFEVPQGASDREVRIVILDQIGEREIYRQRHPPGSKIDLPVVVRGDGKARIFLNDVLVQERPLPIDSRTDDKVQSPR